jgi:Domain of unknown function (DUF5666)
MTDRSNEGATPGAQRSRRTTWLVVAVLVVAVGVVAGLVTANLSKSSPAATAPTSTIPSGTTPAGSPRLPNFTPPQVSGTVASVGSSSFTVTTRGGSTATVKVTSSTKFSGTGITDLSSLKKGTVVAVYGTGTSSSVTATRVTAGFAGAGRGGFPGGGRFPGGRPGAFGTITAIGSDSFTINSRGGTTETVDVTSATTYSSSAGTLSGLSSLKTGEDVIVEGTTSGSVVKATAVQVFQPGTGGGFGGGGFGS